MHLHFFEAPRQVLGDGVATVRRCVVDDHDLEAESIACDLSHPRDTRFEGLGFVVAGDDYAESGRHG